MNPAGNMGWAEFEQRSTASPYSRVIRGGFTAKGELARTTGALATVTGAWRSRPSPAQRGPGHRPGRRQRRAGTYCRDARSRRRRSKGRPQGDLRSAGRWPTMRGVAGLLSTGPGVVRLAWATEIWAIPMRSSRWSTPRRDGAVPKNMTATSRSRRPTTSTPATARRRVAHARPARSGTTRRRDGPHEVTLIGNEDPQHLQQPRVDDRRRRITTAGNNDDCRRQPRSHQRRGPPVTGTDASSTSPTTPTTTRRSPPPIRPAMSPTCSTG